MPGLLGMINPWSKAGRGVNIWQHGLGKTLGQAGLGSRAASTLGGMAMSPMGLMLGGGTLAGALQGAE